MKKAVPILLVALGLLQMTGDITGIDAIKGVAAATGASPAPKVFSAVKGLETYSTRFFIEFSRSFDECRTAVEVEITPELYSRLRGPYNRRNVYGAAIAYAPVLPAELRDAVLRYALCGDAPLLQELGIEKFHPDATPSICLRPMPGCPVPETRFRAPGR